MVAVLPATWFYAKVAFMFNLRVNFGMDKYVIWTIYFLVSLPIVENTIFEKFGQLTSSALESEYLHGLKFE